MESSLYEVLSLIMRYWFIIVILYIVWRIAENAMNEYRAHKKVKKEIDKQFYGEIVIKQSDVNELIGRRFGIKKENVFGRSKLCDIIISSRSLEASHGMITLRGKKLMIVDLSSQKGVMLNGVAIAKHADLADGDEITAGKTVLLIDLEG